MGSNFGLSNAPLFFPIHRFDKGYFSISFRFNPSFDGNSMCDAYSQAKVF
jgi:hypothetical protein